MVRENRWYAILEIAEEVESSWDTILPEEVNVLRLLTHEQNERRVEISQDRFTRLNKDDSC